MLKETLVHLWGNVVLVYDNICYLDRMHAARCLLPFPKPWGNMWKAIGKIIDCFHFGNQTDEMCKTKYNPGNCLLTDDNSEVAEQTFIWLGRFKKIICTMPKVHHLFFCITWLNGGTNIPAPITSMVKSRFC